MSTPGIELLQTSPFRWIWIVPVTILTLNLTVLAVNDELCALILADLAPGINGILLLFEMNAAAVSATLTSHPPSAFGTT